MITTLYNFNLILPLKYSVLTYNIDWNDNVKWNILHLFSTYRSQFSKQYLIRHKIKECGLNRQKTIWSICQKCVIFKKGATSSKRLVNDATMITDLLTCCRERVSLGQKDYQKQTYHLSGFNELELKFVYYHSECRKPIVNKSLIERLLGKRIRPWSVTWLLYIICYINFDSVILGQPLHFNESNTHCIRNYTMQWLWCSLGTNRSFCTWRAAMSSTRTGDRRVGSESITPEAFNDIHFNIEILSPGNTLEGP